MGENMRPCPYCDNMVPPSRPNNGGGRPSPHCFSSECIEAHIDKGIAGLLRQEGDCLIWEGQVASPKGGNCLPGTPIHRVPKERGARARQKMVRVGVRLLEAKGVPVSSTKRLYPSCENMRCVSPDHLMQISAHKVSSPLDCIYLDPTPLHAAVKRWVQVRMGEQPLSDDFFRRNKRLEEYVRNGKVSLAFVDEMCIDYLGVNPVEIYGMEFLEAA